MSNPADGVKHLLSASAPRKIGDLETLFHKLQPCFEADEKSQQAIFRAYPRTRTILVGIEGSKRLEAQCVAIGIINLALARFVSNQITKEVRDERTRIADRLLTWSVSRDLATTLKRIDGLERDLESILRGGSIDLPDDVLKDVTDDERTYSKGFFRPAASFIMLHELGHLCLGHQAIDFENMSENDRPNARLWSMQQEREADLFAADWLLDGNDGSGRLIAIFGIASALLWLTVTNVFFGQLESDSHPQSYDRLFQTLDHCLTEESIDNYDFVWDFVSRFLFLHMDAAGYPFDKSEFQSDDPREEANVLIDKISKAGLCPKCGAHSLVLVSTTADDECVTRNYECSNPECLSSFKKATTK